MSQDRSDLLRGTLDMLILKTLTLEPLHGLGISKRIEQITQGSFRCRQAPSFPPCIVSSRRAGLWAPGENRTTTGGLNTTGWRPAGRRQLDEEQRNWERVALAVARVLDAV